MVLLIDGTLDALHPHPYVFSCLPVICPALGLHPGSVERLVRCSVSPRLRTLLHACPVSSTEVAAAMSPAKLTVLLIYARAGGKLTLIMAVMMPMAMPPPIPGAAKNASPLPSVPSRPAPIVATTAPTAAYFAYRMMRLRA